MNTIHSDSDSDTGQMLLDLDSLPSAPVSDEVADILALLRADPQNDRDRGRIIAAVISVAAENRGVVNSNHVRAKLLNRHGQLDVRPQVVGATINGLTKRGVIRAIGWAVNEDKSGNAGKPQRLYRLDSFPQQRGAR